MGIARAVCVLAVLVCAASAMFSAKGSVIQATPANFEAEVMNFDGVAFVEFYAPWCGHCKNLAPEWEKAAKALSGVVKVVAVDADKHGDLGSKYGVQGFPTIKVFGANKKSPTEYNGGRTSKDIVAAGLKAATDLVNSRTGGSGGSGGSKKSGGGGSQDHGSDVIELTDDSFEKEVFESKEPVLVEFYAPWCGHCKNLAPEWKKAATRLAGLVKVTMVDATVHKKYSQEFGVQGFPTIKFFPPNSRQAEDYNGGRTADAIVDFGMKQADKYPTEPPKVNQLLNADDLKECLKDKMLCLVFSLPHVIDTGASGRNTYIEKVIMESARKMKARSVGLGWISAGEQPVFEEALGLALNAPTFVALNEKKMRYYAHKGKFDVKGITGAVDKLLTGRQSTSGLKEIPKFETTAAWDGKDYVQPEDDE